MTATLFVLIIMLLRIAAEEKTSGNFSGDLECDDGDRSILLTVLGTRDVTSSDIEGLLAILADEANSHCTSSSESFCDFSLGPYFATIQDIHVDVCVSDVSSKRKRHQSTITTIMEVDITDPDDLSQSIDESDLLIIVNAATEDFESKTGFAVEEIRLITRKEEGIKSYLQTVVGIIGGIIGGGVILIVAAVILAIVIVLAAGLVAKRSGKKNKVKPKPKPNSGSKK